MRRSETAHPEPVSADPNGAVAVYSQPGEDWDAAGFEAFLRGSSSQFVMWRRQGARKLENVPQLWDDPRTFALALQVHFRAWKPMLIPTAPFRTLQPGEVSRVLAPVSDTILADREKLLALGIPRCRYATTAWLLTWSEIATGFARCVSRLGRRRRDVESGTSCTPSKRLMHIAQQSL